MAKIDTMWVVFNPGPKSAFDGICYETTVKGLVEGILMRNELGDTASVLALSLYTDEDSATSDAEARLAARDAPPAQKVGMVLVVHGETASWLRARRGLQDEGVIRVRTYSGRVDVGGGLIWFRHPKHGWIEVPSSYEEEQLASLDPDADDACRRLSKREKGDIEIVG
jgi:hypothetical protein